MLSSDVRTGLKARAGAAWVPVSSKYFSHEKLFGCLYSEKMEQKQVPPISHSQKQDMTQAFFLPLMYM